ncbi:MAG TPA: hypothetical protein V6C58_05105 [Allocoleopsis sp.]
MPKNILKPGKKYTFSDYFYLSNPPEEIVKELGYLLTIEKLNFPSSKEPNKDQELIDNLRSTYYLLIPKVSLNSEIAKRELIIAPLLHGVIRKIDVRLNIEYTIEIDDRLSGTIDYLLRSQQQLIVIEAKKGDLEKGFTQLAIEMIALDQYEDDDFPHIIYGVITIGEVWRFAILNRQEKTIIKDIHTFRFPEDLEEIFSRIKGILSSE